MADMIFTVEVKYCMIMMKLQDPCSYDTVAENSGVLGCE